MSDVIQQKLNHVLDRAEDPAESMDLAYQKQLQALQQMRANVADVLTSEKRLELQASELEQRQAKLQEQARTALAQGREDLARLALTRAQTAGQQLGDLKTQIEQLTLQEQKLEQTAQKLQAKVEAFRTQKESLKAQYSAASASTKIGEAVTGLSEQMADVSMMVDRAQDKTRQMQARSAAIDQLIDTGGLDQIGAGSQDDIDRQLLAASTSSNVDAELAALKRELGTGPVSAALGDGSLVVRIQGEDQYRISSSVAEELHRCDEAIVAAIDAHDSARFATTLKTALDLVRQRGTKLEASSLVASDLALPSEDTSLDEARQLMQGGPPPAP
ncbi:MAG TPA: PspA/IM30 family protein [Candidatus Nitrosotalea sp.]|nr:PspA/IM30 family protein [Candidatus Nitrosotalea sp.]